MTAAPIVMGIVNVTPDSFSDGGRWLDEQRAVAHGTTLAAQGAAILDVGGESTRPGAIPVPAEVERERVVEVVRCLAQAGHRVSIDTMKASVAEAALDAGATFVNDVTALADSDMAGLVAERGCDVCLMHMRGTPQTMQQDPRYDDVVDDVRAFLSERVQRALDAGVAAKSIVVDPGIGFGKTVDHNLTLLDRIDEIVALGFPVLVGTSRKSFLRAISGSRDGVTLAETIATNVLALERGATIFRVHNVAAVRASLVVAAATLARQWTETPTTS